MRKNALVKKAVTLLVVLSTVGTLLGCSKKETKVDNTKPTEAVTEEKKTNDETKKTEDTKTEEPVLLRVFMFEKKGTDDAKVSEAISNLPQVKDLGVKVELVKIDMGEYAEKLPLLLSSDEQMDICFDAGWIAYVERAKADAYVDLTPMLDSMPELKKTIPEVLWNGAKIDGKIYGVPTFKEIAEQWHIMADESAIKNAGFEPSQFKKFSDLTPLLKAYKEQDKGVLTAPTTGIASSVFMLDQYDSVDGLMNPMFVVKRDDPAKIVNAYDTEEYKAGVELLHSWFNEGYIPADVLTRENYNDYRDENNFRYGLEVYSYAPQHEITVSGWYNTTMATLPMTPAVVTNTSARGSLFAIPTKCKNPEKALQFLQLWNTDAEVRNMIRYGIEGVHYNLENGFVKFVDGVDELYSMNGWSNGNIFLCKQIVGERDDKYPAYEKFNASAQEAACLGFTPDTTNVADKLTACNAVVAEYGPMLQTGSVDPADYLAKFQKALKDAGIDDIVAEYQKQYDAWLKVK